MFFDIMLKDISSEPAFNSFWLTDRNPMSGHVKRRHIYAPNEAMRKVHERFIAWLRSKKIWMQNATGGIPGMSPVRNVLRHKAYGKRVSKKGAPFRRHFYLIDISSAYAAVDPKTLAHILWTGVPHNLPGSVESVLEFLEKYFVAKREGGLIVGAPASPDLFNLYCEFLIDRRLREVCEKYGITYTRYIDDLTFSSNRRIGVKKRRAIREIVEAAGFKLSHRKAQVLDLTKGPITVNGVGVRIDGRMFMPRFALAKLRGLLHLALAGKKSINEHQIFGMVGIFLSTLNRKESNSTEKKVFEMYREYRARKAAERAAKNLEPAGV